MGGEVGLHCAPWEQLINVAWLGGGRGQSALVTVT